MPAFCPVLHHFWSTALLCPQQPELGRTSKQKLMDLPKKSPPQDVAEPGLGSRSPAPQPMPAAPLKGTFNVSMRRDGIVEKISTWKQPCFALRVDRLKKIFFFFNSKAKKWDQKFQRQKPQVEKTILQAPYLGTISTEVLSDFSSLPSQPGEMQASEAHWLA